MSDFRTALKDRLQQRIDAGAMSAAQVRVERRGDVLMDWAGGRIDWNTGAPAVTPDSVFLIASITKPMVTSAVAGLVGEGLIDLDEPVSGYVPEFAAHDRETTSAGSYDPLAKRNVLLRHCFTHTSGLPDMVPGNQDLRRRNAPMHEFVYAACRAPLLFPPGTDVRYQSAGILMLGEVAEAVTGKRLRDHLAETLFGPGYMSSTHLGWRPDFEGRTVAAKVAANSEDTSLWDHNSRYWRDFGAPWGGAHSTAADISRLLRLMLDRGKTPAGTQVFSPGAVQLMLADHTGAMPGISDRARRANGWGLGWRIQRLGAESWFGSAVPPGAFGHAGATGTLAWADPATGATFTLLTNGLLDAESKTLKACSNITAAALCGGG